MREREGRRGEKRRGLEHEYEYEEEEGLKINTKKNTNNKKKRKGGEWVCRLEDENMRNLSART